MVLLTFFALTVAVRTLGLYGQVGSTSVPYSVPIPPVPATPPFPRPSPPPSPTAPTSPPSTPSAVTLWNTMSARQNAWDQHDGAVTMRNNIIAAAAAAPASASYSAVCIT